MWKNGWRVKEPSIFREQDLGSRQDLGLYLVIKKVIISETHCTTALTL
jgi:hypothetical protein